MSETIQYVHNIHTGGVVAMVPCDTRNCIVNPAEYLVELSLFSA